MQEQPCSDPLGSTDVGNHVVVVGGGIGGIYCARELAKRGRTVTLLEMRAYLGGRIETLDPRGFAGPSALTRRPTFKGECGPMRFELALQPRFAALYDETGIELDDFPPPKAAPSPSLYALAADEMHQGQPLDALQLLTLGVLRMFGQATTFDLDGAVVPKDEGWLARLADDQPNGFEELRRTAVLRGTGKPLHKLGFSNALSQVMSQGAVETIKERGSFFHLLPEDPSALEWAYSGCGSSSSRRERTSIAFPGCSPPDREARRLGADLWASIRDYAIRDWSRDPDGAGRHAWAPGARSWEVRARLRAFPLKGGGPDRPLHICGEAYSDYQGFIEGALRSAADAVATIAGEPIPHSV